MRGGGGDTDTTNKHIIRLSREENIFLEMKTYFIILFLLSMYKVDVENEVKVENEVEVENEGDKV